MIDRIRSIVLRRGRVEIPSNALDDDTDLFAAGLDSLAVVSVMLSIEEEFGIEFPDRLLNRRSFATLATLHQVVASLQQERV